MEKRLHCYIDGTLVWFIGKATIDIRFLLAGPWDLNGPTISCLWRLGEILMGQDGFCLSNFIVWYQRIV